MPVDPNQLSQDKDFLAAAPEDQVKYLSAQDPDFAKAAPADQLGYIGHLTGKSPQPSTFAPPPGTPGIPKPSVDVKPQSFVGTLASAASDIPPALAKVLRPRPVPHSAPTGEMPGSFEGHPENIGEYVPASVGEIAGGVNDIDKGQVARGLHRGLSGAMNLAAPVLPLTAPAAPLTTGIGLLTGAAGQYAGEKGARALGASEDQAALTGDITGLATGFAGGAGASRLFKNTPLANIVEGTYSPQGSKIAASLRSNARIDVPAEATIAHSAIEEGLADRGFSTQDFKGRNGPTALQSGIDNAIDIQEARAKRVIDPIRGEKVDPQLLAQNPELAARFSGKQNITYGDLDAERIKMNKELRRANFYAKDPSAQYAVADPLADTHAATNQARSLVYDKASDVTGYDLRPLKRTESALIKLGDLAETTKNTLSAKAAQHEATPLGSKVATSAKSLIAAKANPVSAFFSYEKQGLTSPLSDFNRNMQSAFKNLKPAKASRSVTLPSYNLNLTAPSGSASMTPMQQLLNLSGGEQIPGENLKLTHPEGKTPAAPNTQEPLEFEGGQQIPARSIPDILGQGLIGNEPLTLRPPGDMPPDLQRVLPFQKPGIPSPIYPGVKK